MKIDAYSILIILSVLVVLSYLFNYLSTKLRIPSVLLLLASGIGLNYAAKYFGFQFPQTRVLLEILGITGLIFIVLEASLDLSIQPKKFKFISRALLSALGLMSITAAFIALLFSYYFGADFRQALLHAIPLSVISSAIAIPSVQNMDEERREFIVYESTFSDIVGIILFNYVLMDHQSGLGSILAFSWNIVLVIVVSIISTAFLVFLLNHTTAHVRFFLTFAILILIYSFAKFLHLPSLLVVLCFGLVLGNFRHFKHHLVLKFFSPERIGEVTKELKIITAETAFIIRTFFFLLFGFSIDLNLLVTFEVILIGLAVIATTVLLRLVFFRLILKITSTPLMLIAPRGLITVLLFYTIPESQRMAGLSEGVLFLVIVFTSLMMTVGLLLNKQIPREEIQDVI
jgi:Kef-type K+ transport system membrane component KefB